MLLAGLIAGTLFGISIGFNPKNLTATTYLEQQQSVIKSLNFLMPLLGLITILLTLTSAILQHTHRNIFIPLLIAAGFLMVSALVTKFGNQPINSIVMTWNKSNMPSGWVELRNKWWSLQLIRT